MELICQCGEHITKLELRSSAIVYVESEKIEREKRYWSAQCKNCQTVYGVNEVKYYDPSPRRCDAGNKS